MVFTIQAGFISPVKIPESKASSKYKVQVFGMNGQTIVGLETTEISTQQYDISAVQGMIILSIVNTETGELFTQKLIQ